MIEKYKKLKYTIQTLNSTVDRNCIQAATASNDLIKSKYDDECKVFLRGMHKSNILISKVTFLTLQTVRRKKTLP